MVCPFVITKGTRKGETCGKSSKSDLIKYCKDHVRNIGVQKELLAHGIDINGGSTEVKQGTSAPSQLTSSGPNVKPLDANYNRPIVKIPPVTAKVSQEKKKNTFISAFESNIDHKIACTPDDRDINMDTVYDEIDSSDGEPVDEAALEQDRIIEEQRTVIETQQQQILQQQRRITSMFTLKQIMYVGLNTTASMIEGISPEKLDGYQRNVATSSAINDIMDEMTADVDSMLGFSEMPAWMRLGLTMGAIASATVAEKAGVYVQEPRTPPVDSKLPEEIQASEHFTPAYKE